MFFSEHSAVKKSKNRARKKRSFIYQDMFGSFVDPNMLSDNLILSLGWFRKGIFFIRFYNFLVYVTILFFILSYFHGFFIFLIFAQWYVYFFLRWGELEAFSEALISNIDLRDQYSTKIIVDEDRWSSWNSQDKHFLARGHILQNIHYSIVPLIDYKLLRQQQTGQFFFLFKYKCLFNKKNIFLLNKLQDLKLKKIKINLTNFSSYLNQGTIFVNNLNLSLNTKENSFVFNDKLIFENFYKNYFFLKDFFFFRNIFFLKFSFYYIKIKSLIINNFNFNNFNFIQHIPANIVKFTMLEYNKWILNFYNIKYKNLKVYEKKNYFIKKKTI